MDMKDIKELGARLATGGKAKTPLAVDSGAIRELAELLDETGLGEIEIETGGYRVRVARQTATAHTPSHAPLSIMSEPLSASRAAPVESPVAKRVGDGVISSPMVGTVYFAPEPGKPPFVKIGDSVREGDTLLIIEAMKTMNPIVAPRSGAVKEICVKDAQPVEFGQALLVLS
jgi:acetyl-CoA carboxylase biotin carboxyl carrier protein